MDTSACEIDEEKTISKANHFKSEPENEGLKNIIEKTVSPAHMTRQQIISSKNGA